MNNKENFYSKDGNILGWIIEDSVQGHVCDDLIELSRGALKKSPTMPPEIDGYRTSSSAFLNYSNLPCQQVQDLVSSQIRVPSAHFESLQVAYYNHGERYKRHHDCFQKVDDEQIKRGGQRTWTALLYLSDVENGGETFFPEIDLKIEPKKGKLVIWKNTDENLNKIEDSVHESLPTINCDKWVATIWVRQNPFILDPSAEAQSMPSIGQQAKNLTKAIAKRAAGGFANTTFPEYVERLNYCLHCEHQEEGRCNDCGCFLAKKAMWSSEDCPKGKWPKLK